MGKGQRQVLVKTNVRGGPHRSIGGGGAQSNSLAV